MTDETNLGAAAPSPIDPPKSPSAALQPAPAKPKPTAMRKRAPKAPAELQHLVVVKADGRRGLIHGEVICAPAKAAGSLVKAGVAREATPTEVELAQPRIRSWKG